MLIRRYALLLLLATLLAAALAQDCSRHCYSGTADFGEAIGTAVEFSFSVVPCTQTVAGHVDQTPLVAFICNDASGADELELIVQTDQEALPFFELQWTYNVSDSGATCASLLDGGLDTAALTFVAARHTATPTPLLTNTTEAGGSLDALEQTCLQDCDPRCFLVPLTLSGEAGASSPCGINATQCDVVLTFTLTPCTGLITGFDVVIGTEQVSLVAYDPARLANVALSCNDGALLLSATGVYVQWGASPYDCTTLMDDLANAALASVQEAAIAFGEADEEWLSALDQGASTALAVALCPVEEPASNATTNEDDEQASAESTKSVRRPITPTVSCSAHMPRDICCTIFGYHNPNTVGSGVYVPRRHGRNWFTPEPHNRMQRAYFHANTTDVQTSSVLWPCDLHERHILTWTLRVPAKVPHLSSNSVAEGNTTKAADYVEADYGWNHDYDYLWERSVSVTSTRNDCSENQIDVWCTEDEV